MKAGHAENDKEQVDQEQETEQKEADHYFQSFSWRLRFEFPCVLQLQRLEVKVLGALAHLFNDEPLLLEWI